MSSGLPDNLMEEPLSPAPMSKVRSPSAPDDSGEFPPVPPTLRLGSIEDLGKIIETFEPDVIVCATDPSHDALLPRELLEPRAQGQPAWREVA